MALTKHGVPIQKPKYDPMKYTPKQIMEMEKRDGVKPTTVQPGQKLNEDGTYQTEAQSDDRETGDTSSRKSTPAVGLASKTTQNTQTENKTPTV